MQGIYSWSFCSPLLCIEDSVFPVCYLYLPLFTSNSKLRNQLLTAQATYWCRVDNSPLLKRLNKHWTYVIWSFRIWLDCSLPTLYRSIKCVIIGCCVMSNLWDSPSQKYYCLIGIWLDLKINELLNFGRGLLNKDRLTPNKSTFSINCLFYSDSLTDP